MCRFVMDGKREDKRPLSAFDTTMTCGSGRGIASSRGGLGRTFSGRRVVVSSSEGYWYRSGSLCEEGWDDLRRPSCAWHVKTPP
jgi:hypothetical protein